MKKTDHEVRYLWAARRMAEALQIDYPGFERDDLVRCCFTGLMATRRSVELALGTDTTGALKGDSRVELGVRLV